MKSPSPIEFLHQTGSDAAHVLVPPKTPLSPSLAASVIHSQALNFSQAAPYDHWPNGGGSSLPHLPLCCENAHDLIPKNLRRNSDRRDNRKSKDPMQLAIAGMSSAPPICRPREVVLTSICCSAASTTAAAGCPSPAFTPGSGTAFWFLRPFCTIASSAALLALSSLSFLGPSTAPATSARWSCGFCRG